MKYKTTDMTDLLEEPHFNAPTIITLRPNRAVYTWSQSTNSETDQPETADGFTFVKLASDETTGWIEPFLLTGYERPEVDKDTFILSCLAAEYDTNVADNTDPFFVSADFVLARAILETNISNLSERARGPTFGPLAVTRDEWGQFVQEYRNIDDFPKSGWDDPISQIWAASYRMRRDARAFSRVATAQGGDPVMPTYVDLFHAYRTSSPELAAALSKAQSGDNGTLQPLRAILETTLGAQRAGDLASAQPDLYGTPTIAALNTAATALLEKLLNDASARIAKLAPQAAAASFTGADKPNGGPLGELIGSGEGNYRSFNTGRAGVSSEQDFSQMTIRQIMAAQANKTYFAVGKYQIVPDTFVSAVDKLRLDTKHHVHR